MPHNRYPTNGYPPNGYPGDGYPGRDDYCAPPLIPEFREDLTTGEYNLYCISPPPQPGPGQAFNLAGLTPFISIAALTLAILALARGR